MECLLQRSRLSLFSPLMGMGRVPKKLGYDVLRLAITDDSVIPAKAGIQSTNNIIAICQVIKIKAKRGNMLFVPHGPISVIPAKAGIQTRNIIIELKKYLIDIAKREDFSFIRIAPVFQDSKEYRDMFANLGFRTAPIYMHAERLWVLDITKDEETLLKEMRKLPVTPSERRRRKESP